MKKNVFIAFILASIMFCGLSCNISKSNKPKLYGLQLVDTSNFKKHFLKELSNYVRRDKKCKVFLLKSTTLFRHANRLEEDEIGGRVIYNEIFVIERATPYSIGKGEFVFSRNYPSQFFMIGDKTIFISSGQDVLQNQKLLKEVYHKLIKEDFLNSQKYYMLVFDAIDSVETVQEKQVYLSPEFDLIHGTHKTEDVDFIPPQIERDKN